MKLSITSLVEGENRFHYHSGQDAWVKSLVDALSAENYVIQSPMDITLNVTKLDPDFYVKGKITFDVEQLCARCAETFTLHVNNPFEIALAKVPAVKYRTPELSEETEEMDVNFFEGNDIDLDPIVTEQFFLSIPYQAICKGDCKGICQRCGTNLNTKKCECHDTSELAPFSVLQEMNLFKQE